jgi:membrane-bound ClpP family serine protease
MDPWVWAAMLLALGLGLAVLEVFFPSAGVLGFLSAAAMLGAILMGFQQGMGTGVGILAVVVIGVPIIVIVAFKVWPHTSMGKQVLLQAPSAEDVLPGDADDRRRLKGLIGQIGRARCKMLPGGVVDIDGRSVDAVSEGVAIEAGRAVRVMKVQGTRVVVRPIEDEVPAAGAENPLERPIDSIVADPFSEPPLDRQTNSG